MAKRASKGGGGGGGVGSTAGGGPTAVLTLDVSQALQAPAIMAGVGAQIEGSLGGVDAATKKTASEIRLLTATIQKETATIRADSAKLTITEQEESSKRIQQARVAAAETIDISRAALEEELRIQSAADAKELAQLKADLKKKQSALDKAHETRARNKRAALQKELQDDRIFANAALKQAGIVATAQLQNQKLLANSATTQGKLAAQAQMQANRQVHQTTITNSINATRVQVANINQVTAANNNAARAALNAAKAQQRANLSAQQHQQRAALQKQQGGGGFAAAAAGVGGAIYTIKTVVEGVTEVIRMGVEIGKMTTSYNRQLVASRNLAGGTANLNKLMAAYNRATGGAVDKATALQDVTRLQAIGFAKNAKELERFVKAARGISLAVGKDMDEITEEVALTIANQSTRRLDQIGLGVDEVRNRIEKLREENRTWTREMAFQEAVLQIADEKYGDLTSSLDAQATGVEKLTSSWKDYLLVVAQGLSGPIQAAADHIAKTLDEMAEKTRQHTMEMARATQFDIPGGIGPANLREATKRRDDFQGMLDHARANPENLPQGAVNAQIAKFTEELRKAAISIAGINARIQLQTNTLPSSSGSPSDSLVTPPKGNDLSDDQYQVLFDLEQDRVDMEADFARTRNEAVQEYEDERTKIITNFEKQLVRDAEDFALQRQRAQEDHQKAMADVVEDGLKRQQEMAEDLADRIAKANRDSADRVAEINEDYGRKVEDMREDSSDRVIEMEEDAAEREQDLREDSAEKIADMEKDYAKQRKNNLRDYNDSVLSAAANLDAKAVWEAQRRFARENQEAEEAHEEKVSEEKKSLDKALAEQKENLAEKIKEEGESLQKSIQQATEMRDEQIEDEGKALAKRNEDARTSHAEQLLDAKNKDAQRLIDMQTDFDARLIKEDADRAIRLGRMQTDHNDQLTELGEQQKKRMTQIGIQEGEARDAFDEAYTDRLQDAGIFNTAWMLAQAEAEAESLDLFRKMFDGMNEIMGKTTIPTPNGLSPVVAGWKKQLEDQRAILVGQLDNGLSPEEYRRIDDLIKYIDQQLGLLAGVSEVVDQSIVNGSSLPSTTAPITGKISGLGAAGMNVVIEQGAIVITPLPGQSAESVGDDFEKRLLGVLQKVGKVGVR